MMLAIAEHGAGAVAALLFVLGVSAWLGLRAQRAIEKKEFMAGYFLGNRGLGVWVLALTATVQSGGTFMGFPSLVYSHGWVVAFWIGSYMIVALTNFAVLGKRLAQLSRLTGAITMPDLFGARFNSPATSLTCSLLVIFFMGFSMLAQFKAGALLIKNSFNDPALPLAAVALSSGPDWPYLIGLAIFTFGVLTYTVWGGFLASAWTDFFQSILMLVGVLVLLALVIPMAGGLEQASRTAVANTSPQFATGPGYSSDGRQFMPLSLGISAFFIWTFGGMGSPAAIVRMMASRSTADLRRGMFVLSVYNFLIYVPLILICICGRALIPGLQASDEIIPRLALITTEKIPGGSIISGLIMAAPFGAVLATVSTYLVVIASGLVRDVYLRFVNPNANESSLRRTTFLILVGLGVAAMLLNLEPVTYLQALIVFSATGSAASFVVPALMVCFWRKATAAGTISSMLAGALTVLVLLILGSLSPDPMIGPASRFRPYYLLGFDPILWGMAASLAAGWIVSRWTQPPPAELLAQLFDTPLLNAAHEQKISR